MSKHKVKKGEEDFTEILQSIKEYKPEIVFAPLYLEIIELLKQVKKLQIITQIIASAPFENQIILDKAQKTAEGVIYPYHYSVQPVNEQDNNFRQKYKKRFGKQPEGFAALAYDGAYLIFKVLTIHYLLAYIKKERLARCLLRKNFHEIYHYGITGETVFQNNNSVIRPIFIKTVQDGEFADYEEVLEEEFIDDLRLCPSDI